MASRSYRSPLRAEQARQTQRRILDATRELLLGQGYTATTMTAVAARAGVSAQTVYNAFGTKAALVKRLYDVTLVGDDDPVPLAARPEFAALRATTDPRALLAGYAALGRTLIERLGPLLRTLPAGDPELAGFLETIGAERLAGTAGVAARLDALGALRPGLGVDRARDAIWLLTSVDVWALLVEGRGWTGDEYAQWVAGAMAAAILP